MEVKYGEIYYVNLGEGRGSIQGNIRPCIVISNDMCNKYSPIITMIAVTSKMTKKQLPTHVYIGEETGLKYKSVALCEQILTVNKSDLISKVGQCSYYTMKQIENATSIQINKKPIDITYLLDLINEIKNINQNLNQKYTKELEIERVEKISELYDYCTENFIDYNSILKKYFAGEYLGMGRGKNEERVRTM